MIYRAFRLACVAAGAAALLALTHSALLFVVALAGCLIATAPAAYGRGTRLRP